jgi:hypothetical protein
MTLALTSLLGLTGYFAKYWNDVRTEERQNRLDRVNRQLSDFYGPLYSLLHVGGAAWWALRIVSPVRPMSEIFERPSEAEFEAGRLWIREIFMPLYRQMVATVIENADLLEGDEMPKCLLDLCTHVYAYEAVLKQWESGDFTVHTSAIPFPRAALEAYLNEQFLQLKAEQLRLIGQLQRGSRRSDARS